MRSLYERPAKVLRCIRYWKLVISPRWWQRHKQEQFLIDKRNIFLELLQLSKGAKWRIVPDIMPLSAEQSDRGYCSPLPYVGRWFITSYSPPLTPSISSGFPSSSLVQFYAPGWGERGTRRILALIQINNTMTRPGLELRPIDSARWPLGHHALSTPFP